jgi:hypothetical protein
LMGEIVQEKNQRAIYHGTTQRLDLWKCIFIKGNKLQRIKLQMQRFYFVKTQRINT